MIYICPPSIAGRLLQLRSSDVPSFSDFFVFIASPLNAVSSKVACLSRFAPRPFPAKLERAVTLITPILSREFETGGYSRRWPTSRSRKLSSAGEMEASESFAAPNKVQKTTGIGRNKTRGVISLRIFFFFFFFSLSVDSTTRTYRLSVTLTETKFFRSSFSVDWECLRMLS